MKPFWLIVTLLVLGACAAPPPGPEKPAPVECLDPEKSPIDGGLGGTGKAPEDPCQKRRQG